MMSDDGVGTEAIMDMMSVDGVGAEAIMRGEEILHIYFVFLGVFLSGVSSSATTTIDGGVEHCQV